MSQDKETPKPGASDSDAGDNSAYQRPLDTDSQDAEPLDKDELAQLFDEAGDHAGDAAASEAENETVDEPAAELVADASDSTEPPADAGVAAAAVAVKRPSKIPLFLTLLVALGALGLSGYLYYELRYLDPLAPFEDRMDELAGRAERNRGELEERSSQLTERAESMRGEIQSLIDSASAQQSSQADELRNELAEQQDNLEAAQAALAESLGETIAATPPSDRDWKLAEAEYLLRIANHRLLMERDADTAHQLLTSADQILLELGDFSLYDVRAQLAEEMLAVGSLTRKEANSLTDLTGVFLQLDAIKNNLGKLTTRLPEYLKAKVSPQERLEEALDEPTAQANQSVWQQAAARLSAFFEYRKIEGEETRRPLLSPDEAVYLEMNLRLMLERSQMALLRRNQLIYETSLDNAAQWMETYYDPDDADVIQMHDAIDELRGAQLERDLPDISGSLRALQRISRGQEGQP